MELEAAHGRASRASATGRIAIGAVTWALLGCAASAQPAGPAPSAGADAPMVVMARETIGCWWTATSSIFESGLGHGWVWAEHAWGWSASLVESSWSWCVGVGLGAGVLAGEAWSMLAALPEPSVRLAPAPGLYVAAEAGHCPCGTLDPEWEAWRPEYPGPDQVVILVHGLDEPGCVWDGLAPELLRAGHRVARFEYPNDQPIADSSRLLRGELNRLGVAGVDQADFVCHSMGGLVVLDALTASCGSSPPGHVMPRVRSVVTFGTPFQGSPWARARAVTEAREQFTRWRASDEGWAELVGGLADGRGEAGRDLLPGSAFLETLETRSLPSGLLWTSVVGTLVELPGSEAIPELSPCWFVDGIGDGVVSIASASAGPPGEVVRLRGLHRDIVRGPAATDLVLARLAPAAAADRAPGR